MYSAQTRKRRRQRRPQPVYYQSGVDTGPELKNHDLDFNQALYVEPLNGPALPNQDRALFRVNPPTWNCWNGVALGTSSSQRIGRRIRMTKFCARVNLRDIDNVPRDRVWRFLCVLDTQTNKPPRCPGYDQVLNTGQAGGELKTTVFLRPENSKRFKILYDKTFVSRANLEVGQPFTLVAGVLTPGPYPARDSTLPFIHFNFEVPMNIVVNFSNDPDAEPEDTAGNISNIVDNSIICYMITDQLPNDLDTEQPAELKMTGRLYYYDE